MLVLMIKTLFSLSHTKHTTHTHSKQQTSTATADSTITISPKKAKELKITTGDVVVVIGRRRRATYATVAVGNKKPVTQCIISENLAANLRLRQDDKIKVVPLSTDDDLGERSGDLLLIAQSPQTATAVTVSPVEDSWNNLIASEGEVTDDEWMERFVKPYLEESGGLLKKGHTLKLRDENGKLLEVIVTHMEHSGTTETGKFVSILYCKVSSMCVCDD